ncbi:hypothetical protein Tco_0499602 [Tanacetum coccineum]
MFDEYFNPPPSVVSPVRVATAPRPADPTGSPSSTSIDQASPSASTSSTINETQSPIISEGVEEQLQPSQHVDDPFLDLLSSKPSSHELLHPAKAETRGVTSWISSQHNGVNNRESLHA